MTYRRRYRRLRRTLRRLPRRDRRALGIALAVVAGLVFLSHAGQGSGDASASAGTGAPPTAAPRGVAARIIDYAKAELGQPYVWGGTGGSSGGYDCSGLAMEAYASAGIYIPRTSQEQWTYGPQVSVPKPGDLVFFAGGDGTWSAPGHVGIYIAPHLMIDAYISGTNVRYDTFGEPTSAGGLTDPVGFTDPMGSR